LTFYGLLPGPAWERIGFPLRGEEGLLVAFRSEILHEVTAVRQGDRYTIVTWFV
jgi:predicted 2-oxoglutarate/Fe(II)-dependent dioxygenase YbiX